MGKKRPAFPSSLVTQDRRSIWQNRMTKLFQGTIAPDVENRKPHTKKLSDKNGQHFPFLLSLQKYLSICKIEVTEHSPRKNVIDQKSQPINVSATCKKFRTVLTQVVFGPDGAMLIWMFPPRPYPVSAPIHATDFWTAEMGAVRG